MQANLNNKHDRATMLQSFFEYGRKMLTLSKRDARTYASKCLKELTIAQSHKERVSKRIKPFAETTSGNIERNAFEKLTVWTDETLARLAIAGKTGFASLAKEAQEKQWHKEQSAKKLTRIVYSEKEEKLITLIEYAKKQGKLRITPFISIGSIAVTKARNIIALVNAGKGKSLYQHKGTSANPGIIIRKKNK